MSSRASKLERSTASHDALEVEIVQALASETLEKWSRSGTDSTVLRGTDLTWKTPGGGTEIGFVGQRKFTRVTLLPRSLTSMG